MTTLSVNKKKPARARVAEVVPDSLARSGEDAANRVAEVLETASARVSKQAGTVGDRASEIGGQVGDRVREARRETQKKAKRSRNDAVKAGVKAGALSKLRPSSDAIIKAQLAKTTRELAHESSDLNEAVSALNSVIKANRKAGARGRTRLFGGLAIGAAIMYHLDPVQGGQRRAATARRLNGLVRSGS